MSVIYYDESLVEKIQEWINIPDLKVLGPNESAELFRIQADINKDKPLRLPLISLSRESTVELEYPHKKPMSFDGITLKALGPIDKELEVEILTNPAKYPNWKIEKGKVDNTYSLVLNAIPMTLRYQLDIYTRKADEGDELVRNFVFNFINDPVGKIELPYNNVHWEHNYTVYLDENMSDNSDIPQRLFKDQFTRWTLGLSISPAYLFNIPKYDNLKAEITVETDKYIK